MKIVLWDTRRNDVQKDFAGGMGVGMHPGHGGWRGKLIRHWYLRDYRPVAMNFAYLAAIFRRLGHEVRYHEDRIPAADVYVFNPALMTLAAERAAMRTICERDSQARILVTGQVAYGLPHAFADLPVTVVRGEPEQLLWKLDDVLAHGDGDVSVGSVRHLDELPFPDWSPFAYRRFRINYDFWKFPTGLIQQSRGCTFKCNYCPYIMVESKTRFREPEAVVEEIQRGMRDFGFRSFKFRDPLFGLDRPRTLRLAELITKLPQRIQFSIETRIDLMRDETLATLRRAGLTSITVGIETPNEQTLRQHQRTPIQDDRQRDFIQRCRGLGIRTVAGFMIGFPDDTSRDVQRVLNYARQVNPTYANFNIVTPYPGTPFFEDIRTQIANEDYSQYSVYRPVLRYKHLTPQELSRLHGRCFGKFYFRSRYLVENAHLLWPILQTLGVGRPRQDALGTPPARRAPAAPQGAPLQA